MGIKAIICAADDTLEPPQTVFNEQGQKVQIIDGVGHIDHQCRDPAPLWRAVKEGIVRPYDEAILGNSVRASDLVKDTEYYEIPELYRAE